MHSTRMKTSSIALAVLCAAFVLTLDTPRTVIAQSCVQTAETSQEVSGIWAEQYSHTFVSQPLGAYLAVAGQQMPTSRTAYGWQPEGKVRVELQVPAALLRTLLMEQESNRPLELRVPAALLTTLSTEDWVQIPQRSSELWEQFFSLY